MRIVFLMSLITLNHYSVVLTSTGGRTMYVNTNGGLHEYNDSLNIKLYYSIEKVAIEQRDEVRVYKRSVNSSHEQTLYFMKRKLKDIPNVIFLYHDHNDNNLYIRYYYMTNNKSYLSKTEIYHEIKLSNYDRVSTISKRNNKRRLKKAIHQ
jgi:hypothetical protein